MRIREQWDKGKLISHEEIEEPEDRVIAAKKVLQDKVDASMMVLSDITSKTSMSQKDIEDAIRLQTAMIQDMLGVTKIDVKKVKL